MKTIILTAVILVFGLCFNAYSQSSNNIKYYGYYWIQDPGKNLDLVNEVAGFTNIINVRYDNGPNNSWDPANAAKIRNAGVKIMLQVPFGTDSNQTLFVDSVARNTYLNQIRQDMINTDVLNSLAYFSIYEEWYVLISQGYYDAWPIFQGKTKEQKFAIAKQYLEQIIDDVHRVFPGIPTVIVENILPYPPPPNNVDVIGIDAYYIPTNPTCDQGQRAKFNNEVTPYYEAARIYNKPIMMVAPSFVGGPWRILSECQMDWYKDLAQNTRYRIESVLWFAYGNVGEIMGVRNFPNTLYYQSKIGCQLAGGRPCVVLPEPPPEEPVVYTINLKADNGKFVAAEFDGGQYFNAVYANRDNAYAWETFSLIDLNGGLLVSGDWVGIRTGSGYYFRAESGGGSTIDTTATSLGAWEEFMIEKVSVNGRVNSGDRVYFRTWSGIYFIVAELNLNNIVSANRTAVGSWETFTINIR